MTARSLNHWIKSFWNLPAGPDGFTPLQSASSLAILPIDTGGKNWPTRRLISGVKLS
jgi:hypothetical protein